MAFGRTRHMADAPWERGRARDASDASRREKATSDPPGGCASGFGRSSEGLEAKGDAAFQPSRSGRGGSPTKVHPRLARKGTRRPACQTEDKTAR